MAKNTDLEPATREDLTGSLKELATDLGVLLRHDLEEARAEMIEKTKAAGMGAGLLSGSVLATFLALFSLTVLLIVLLAAVTTLWTASLIVTLFWGATAALLALSGKRKIEEAGPPIPEQAIANIKADLRAAKEEIKT